MASLPPPPPPASKGHATSRPTRGISAAMTGVWMWHLHLRERVGVTPTQWSCMNVTVTSCSCNACEWVDGWGLEVGAHGRRYLLARLLEHINIACRLSFLSDQNFTSPCHPPLLALSIRKKRKESLRQP
eukprot:1044195-Pelagomonas_calceolata.AAC.3